MTISIRQKIRNGIRGALNGIEKVKADGGVFMKPDLKVDCRLDEFMS